MIQVAVAVERYGRNAFGGSTLGGQFAHQGGHVALVLAGGGFRHLLVQRGCRGQGHTCEVINKLHVDLLVATIYSHARLFGRTTNNSKKISEKHG